MKKEIKRDQEQYLRP